MIRAVGFDLDGTLVDHQGAVASAIRTALTRDGVAVTDEVFGGLLQEWRALERRHMDQYLAGVCTFAEQRRRRLATFRPLIALPALDAAAADAWFSGYARDYEAGWTSYADVIPCLDALADVRPKLPLAVLTNGDGAQQRAKLARFGILERFEHVLVSSEIGAAKPDPAAFRAMTDRLGVSPPDVLFVGDWLELDAEGATAAGLVGVWLDRTTPSTGSLEPAVGCPRITSLTALPALVADG